MSGGYSTLYIREFTEVGESPEGPAGGIGRLRRLPSTVSRFLVRQPAFVAYFRKPGGWNPQLPSVSNDSTSSDTDRIVAFEEIQVFRNAR